MQDKVDEWIINSQKTVNDMVKRVEVAGNMKTKYSKAEKDFYAWADRFKKRFENYLDKKYGKGNWEK